MIGLCCEVTLEELINGVKLHVPYPVVPGHQSLPVAQRVLGLHLLQIVLQCLVDPVGLIHLWAWHAIHVSENSLNPDTWRRVHVRLPLCWDLLLSYVAFVVWT